MRHYGIIGNPLEHSYSARHFAELFAREHIDADYTEYPITDLPLWMAQYAMSLDGFNVTYPYKEQIIPYLDALDTTAQAIGAVNVVAREQINGKTILRGYNTDQWGFRQAIAPLLRTTDQQALVLGTGGAAKAIVYALHQLQIRPTLVSRRATDHTIPDGCNVIRYTDLTQQCMQTHRIIINTTPLGMLGCDEGCPDIPYEYIDSQHLLYDCIYNPERTLFLTRGHEKGACVCNGLQMLIGQAQAAWQIWNHTTQTAK